MFLKLTKKHAIFTYQILRGTGLPMLQSKCKKNAGRYLNHKIHQHWFLVAQRRYRRLEYNNLEEEVSIHWSPLIKLAFLYPKFSPKVILL